jgi:hypothetical protein
MRMDHRAASFPSRVSQEYNPDMSLILPVLGAAVAAIAAFCVWLAV